MLTFPSAHAGPCSHADSLSWEDSGVIRGKVRTDGGGEALQEGGERDGGQRFRRLDAPECLPEVGEGVVFVDGVREKRGNAKVAA